MSIDPPAVEKINKLPKWARDYIAQLECENTRNADAAQKLRSAERVEGEAQFFIANTSGDVTWLPKRPRIHLCTPASGADDPRYTHTVTLPQGQDGTGTHGQSILIRGMEPVAVLPQASNAVRVAVSGMS